MEQTKKAAGILTAPYREKIAGVGVRTYNLDADIELPDGSIVVLPEDVTEACWHLTTDGRLKLMCDGECVAAGPAGADVGTFEYDLPRYTTSDGEQYILSSDGGIRDRGDAVLNRWPKASPPHPAYHHHYLAGTRLITTAGNPLSEIPLPLGDPTELTESNSDIWRRVLKTYLDTALVKKEGAEVYRSQIRHEVMALINKLSSPLLDESDWPTVEPPNRTWFGRAWPDSEASAKKLEQSARKFDSSMAIYENNPEMPGDSTTPEVDVIETEDGWVNGEKVKRVQDYTLVYPEGITSSHTSHVYNDWQWDPEDQ